MKRSQRGFPTYFFFILSLCILALTGYGIVVHGHKGIEDLIPSLQDKTAQKREYISGYLSYMTRLKITHDALIILEEEKKKLARIQRELDDLEISMESFLCTMEEKQKLYEAHVSSFDIAELIKDFKAAAHIDKCNTHFNNELNRRKRVFYKGYESKRKRLLDEKNTQEKKISELSRYIKEVQQKGPLELLNTDGLFILEETKKLNIERAILLIKQEEYKRAAEALKTAIDTGFDNQGILVKLLNTMDELERKRIQLATEDPFADLKLSYLAEDYEKALDQVDKLNTDPFLRPLLGEISPALYRNIQITGDIEEDLVLRKDVKELIGKASKLEKIGEYEKAVELYRKLLLLDLPPHDREYLSGKLYTAMELSIAGELKRRDNTRAIKLLEDARKLAWEGNKDEAMKQYLLLIKECPNSDYVGQAVGEIIELRG